MLQSTRQIIESVRKRAWLVGVFSRNVQQSNFLFSLRELLRHASIVEIAVTEREWKAIYKAHGVITSEQIDHARAFPQGGTISVQIMEIVREKARIIEYFCEILQVRVFQYALNETIRYSLQFQSSLSVKEWIAILQAFGILTYDDYQAVLGGRIKSMYFELTELNKKMQEQDWA